MNTAVIMTLQLILKTVGGYLAGHGMMAGTDVEKFVGGAMIFAGALWQWFHHNSAVSNAADAASTPPTFRKLPLLLMAAAVVAPSLVGCTTALQSDKIVAIKTRGIGLIVETANVANGTPTVKFGFVSTVVQLVPTSTNAPVQAPRYMDTFDTKSGFNPFDIGIKEATGSGDVMVGQGTNDTSKAIIPSGYIPPK